MINAKLSPTALAAVVALSLGAVAVNGAAAQSASPIVPQIDWTTSLNKFQYDNDKFVGQRFTAECLPAAMTKKESVVYGTDIYPSNNSICTAALHAGKIDKKGGVVTVQLNPGETSYSGSSRNGVETADLPGTPRSMVFVDETTAATADPIHLSHIPYIKWDKKFTATGFAYKQLVGQRFTFNCLPAPGNLRSRRIVGTDSYAFNSMICRAAVHAGRITTDGGIVSVQMDPGQTKLVGSIRNGVESKDGSGGHTTISFVDPSVQN